MISTTAVEAWDKRWATPEGRTGFLQPHPEVTGLLTELKARGVRSVLDLGCGVGRHSLLLANEGFDVHAVDGSANALKVLDEAAKAKGLTVSLHQGNADNLPFAGARFDFVIAWDVIYHGNIGETGCRIAEIWRVLKPEALFQGTMLPLRNANFGAGRLIAPGTFVDDTEDRGHPHFYCDAVTVATLFSGFEILKLGQHLKGKPGSWHWNIIAERAQ